MRLFGPRPRRTWFQRLLITFNVVLIFAASAGAAGLTYVRTSVVGELPRVAVGPVLSEDEVSGEAQNFLLVGVDNASNLAEDDPIRLQRDDANALTDTMMVLRVDPDSEEINLLSIPRDLWVDIEGAGYQAKINAAMPFGGPETLIQTIQSNLDIPIHHFVSLDFAGFINLVDEIGGIPIYLEQPIRDDRVGLRIEQTGCVTLDPGQALSYVRTRRPLTLENGEWVQLGVHSDLERIDRQQDFLVAALRQGVNQGLRHPLTLNRFLDAGQDSITLDEFLSVRDMIDLANRFRSYQPEELIRHELPVVDGSAGSQSVLRLVDDEAQEVLDIFRGVEPGEVTPQAVRVQVLNGSGRPGEAGSTADALAGSGFTITGVGDETGDHGQTVVRYAPADEAKAVLVARYLVGGALLEPTDAVQGTDVVVVTGDDYRGARPQAGPPELALGGNVDQTPDGEAGAGGSGEVAAATSDATATPGAEPTPSTEPTTVPTPVPSCG